MTSEDNPHVDTIASLFEDRMVQTSLSETSQQSVSANPRKGTLWGLGTDKLPASRPLREGDSFVDVTRPDCEGRHGRTLSDSNLDRINSGLVDGSLSVEISVEGGGRRFTRLIEVSCP